MDVSEKIM